ncbi:hypothetical protein GCM10023187_09050 [Nibrella viscosa]|uniref:Smr domain-containing protein n=1 Tax=Nibrella viscosa TaxID=1084524 RepID=A0ABP8K0H6_9BACT
MNIGDRVRMLRAKEEGVVTRFLSGNQVEIEIEDGFRIPVMRSELVVVSPLEAERLLKRNTPEPQKATAPSILSNQGIYLAFIPQNDREMSLHFVNNTDWDLPFTIGEERGNQVRGLQSGVLKPKSQVKLNELYTVAGFENWPTFLVQALWFRAASVALRPPLVKRLKCRAATFYKSKQTVPVLNQSGHLFQLDTDESPPDDAGAIKKTVAPDALKQEMLTPKSEPVALAIERPSAVVDLHIEALLPGGPGKRSNSELLEIQLQAFEKSLENAIASGMSDITFIHGVGSGALRNELHRRLGRHPHVRYYEDAQKQKFGYGATKVTIR